MSLLGKIGYNISKGVCSFVAPLAAVSSMAGKGGDGIWDNLLATYHAPKMLGTAAIELARESMGFRDLEEAVEVIRYAGQNLIERPVETVVTAAGVWGATKYAPQGINLARKAVSKIRDN
jgi:hypothetical protein